MDYDFRNRTGPPYDSQGPMYRPTTTTSSSSSSSSAHPIWNWNQGCFETEVSDHATGRPQLSPHSGDIPRSTFEFDFDLERKILAEAEKGSQNWSRLGLENFSSKTAESTSSYAGRNLAPKPSLYSTKGLGQGSTTDPIVSKYIASGLSRETVPLAVANYGDNPTKVRDFANGYTLLRDMGFPSNNVAEALLMYDNDTDKALAQCLNGSS
ncbi:hypothetical protein RJ640_023169 [Escallonia rubra]|uniref:UBA domain-containing protein n=1 Tax=Escallonia rubra TaxID=112253 RepID=A0AA88S7J1_9ASTE|nr:hypothetical protein RJ640_023169 [Escallonia rubra]